MCGRVREARERQGAWSSQFLFALFAQSPENARTFCNNGAIYCCERAIFTHIKRVRGASNSAPGERSRRAAESVVCGHLPPGDPDAPPVKNSVQRFDVFAAD